MNINELNDKINQFLKNLQEKIVLVVNFIISRLKNYKNMTLGEQIAYPCVGAGFLLFFIGIILFIF